MENKSLEILEHYWGFNSFRPLQQEIINSVLNKNDTFALLPTGGGKSICFQVPALCTEGVCIVISPLIALIEDQINSLIEKGIKALQIPSGSSEDDIITIFDNIRFGKYKFLYISPERLQSKFIQKKIAQLKVSLIAIDEAHCISEWGHDFRPSFRNISVLRNLHPKTKFIALTATATNIVVADIIESLELKNTKVFKKSFHRKNLIYTVTNCEDKLYKLKQIFNKFKEPAIVYVNSRKKTKDIANYLNANNYKATFYNGELTSSEKKENFDSWLQEKSPIMVATNAFGMGIDKANVRVVIHYDLSKSIENYVQESGRAGRDGKNSYAVSLVNNSDIQYSEEFQAKTLPTIEQIKYIHRKLYQHYQIAMGDCTIEEYDFDLVRFSEKYNCNTLITFNTLQILSSFGIIEFNPKAKLKSRILFTANSNAILNFVSTNQKFRKFTQTLLRLYTGIFEKEITIDEFFIAKKAGISSTQVSLYLNKLTEHGLMEYHKKSKKSSIFFLQVREDDRTINLYSKEIKQYLKQKKLKTTEFSQFIKNNNVCRNIQILKHFNETSNIKCGKCDACKKTISISKNTEQIIIKKIKSKPISTRELCKDLPYKEQEILLTLRRLLSEGIIGFKKDLFHIK